MSKKTKTITVYEGFAMPDDTQKASGYKIAKVTDSLQFTPGGLIRKKELEELCAANDWKVTILPFPSGMFSR